MNPRIATFLKDRAPALPCLIIDLDVVAQRYQHLCATFPDAKVFYAVKANPEAAVIRLLVRLGASFDVASPAEVDLCLAAGAAPDTLSYGNTIKKREDIAGAHELGVRLFAFDSAGELDKLAAVAPGSAVFCRILVGSGGANWPLGRKFGCATRMAADLLRHADALGLEARGVSFHVGSQQLEPSRWRTSIIQAAEVFTELEQAGIRLEMLNLGGGFPADYCGNAPALEAYSQAIYGALADSFDRSTAPTIAIEPGRCVAGDAGILRTTVVLTARKSYEAVERWVYLDAGRYGGLPETEGEAIRYRIATAHDGSKVGPVILAGPTCDSADVLYEDRPYELPLCLVAGDYVDLLSAGAYTASYCSVAFNGFPPLRTYCIGATS